MSAVYNPEADIIADIERLERQARDTHRKVEHARNQEDRRVLNRLLQEMKDEIAHLRLRLPADDSPKVTVSNPAKSTTGKTPRGF